MPSKSEKIHHLYNRAGFGLSLEQLLQKRKLKLRKELVNLLKKGTKDVPLTVIQENPFVSLGVDLQNKTLDRNEVNMIFSTRVKESREKLKGLTIAWMDQMIHRDTMVREKITLFWHDHFGVRSNNGYHAQLHNNLLRKHALGKYRDLLLAVAKDPAMLQFLNNQQNNKRKPNENFARELLELYTLGRGHYTESDIKSAAKAFTGWKFDRFSCEFRFNSRQHDTGDKVFMGRSGSFNGEEIIEIILSNKRTAYYLSAKLFQYYVSDQADEAIIGEMADRLFESDYDIGDLMSYIFKADWFYEARFINSKIKSPHELIHGVRRHFGFSAGRPEVLVYLQNSLRHRLFFPPSVNGWPVGREWINSSSLVNRMRLVSLLAKNEALGIRLKEDLDNDKLAALNGAELLKTCRMNWAGIEEKTAGCTDEEMIDLLTAFLTNKELDEKNRGRILRTIQKKKEDNKVKWLTLTIAGLPEYQLA
ncbi:MAG: DUF1800 domain-containing protein [Roseivirga sp.]